MTTRTFRPSLNVGQVYARAVGSTQPLQSIGGVEELSLNIEEETIKQTDYSRAGGGTRAQVKRVESVMMSAILQDLNVVNLARAVFGTASSVVAATVTDEAVTAYRGGLVRLAHLSPTSVVVRDAANATIPAAGNYEVRPEGLFIPAESTLTNGQAITVSYAFGGYDLVQALTTAAPVLEITFAGVNEADEGRPSVVDLYRVQMGATKGLGLIDKEFGTLEIEGEVLLDPTKNGAGLSRFFRVQMA